MEHIYDFLKESGIQVSSILGGEPYFSARVIGEFLGYPDPLAGINNILRRNPYLNNPTISINSKLEASDGKKYNTRLFNFVGLQLLVYSSQQPKATAFKIAVANFGWAAMQAAGTLKR